MLDTIEEPMAKSPDIAELSGKQLAKLIADAQALQHERKAGRIQELKHKWATEADEEGFSIMEVVGMQKAAKAKKGDGSRTPAAMKYRLPDNKEWSGKGRLPLSLRDALKGSKGYDEETATFEDKDARDAALSKFLL